MRNIWTVAWREFRQYFGSPIAYALAVVVFGFIGALFALQLAQTISSSSTGSGSATMEGQVILGPLMTLFLFGLPALTMRLFSEENRQGTLEILLTSPVRDSELVLGKWLGALMFSTIILALTWIFPIFLNVITKPNGIDQGPLVSSYLVFFLLTGSLLAIGLVFSSIFANSIAAFFSSVAVGLTLWLSGMFSSLATYAGSTGGSSWITSLWNYLDFTSHFYNNAYAGKLDLTDIIYYLSIIVLGLFLTTQIVQSKRWR